MSKAGPSDAARRTKSGAGTGNVAAPLPASVLEAATRHGVSRRFAAGDVLFHEGDASDAMYLLLSGQLRVFARNATGREVVYNVLEPGELLGEMLLDGGPRSASVEALVASECLVVDAGHVHGLLRESPDFAERLVLKLILRMRQATRTIRGMALEGVYERVVALLEQVAVSTGAERRVPRELTQLEIARRVGASREMVNVVIRDLVRGGHIRKDRAHRMTLLAPLPPRW
jgi:CRP/FNR family cyclic AMP-dependent transcriptional regulator